MLIQRVGISTDLDVVFREFRHVKAAVRIRIFLMGARRSRNSCARLEVALSMTRRLLAEKVQ